MIYYKCDRCNREETDKKTVFADWLTVNVTQPTGRRDLIMSNAILPQYMRQFCPDCTPEVETALLHKNPKAEQR